MLKAYVLDIYERSVGPEYPVVQHEFYGRSRAEARGYLQAHMTTDKFMSDCMLKGRWGDVLCRSVGAWRDIAVPLEDPAPIGAPRFAPGIVALVVDIYESAVGDAYPVVRHVFLGKTKEEARGYFKAHMGTCEFMRDCVKKRRWKQVKCRAYARWFDAGHWSKAKL